MKRKDFRGDSLGDPKPYLNEQTDDMNINKSIQRFLNKRLNAGLIVDASIHIPEEYSGVRMELGEFATPEDIMDSYNDIVAREDIPQLTGYWQGIFYTEDDIDTTLDAVLDELNYAIGLDNSEDLD